MGSDDRCTSSNTSDTGNLKVTVLYHNIDLHPFQPTNHGLHNGLQLFYNAYHIHRKLHIIHVTVFILTYFDYLNDILKI